MFRFEGSKPGATGRLEYWVDFDLSSTVDSPTESGCSREPPKGGTTNLVIHVAAPLLRTYAVSGRLNRAHKGLGRFFLMMQSIDFEGELNRIVDLDSRYDREAY